MEQNAFIPVIPPSKTNEWGNSRSRTNKADGCTSARRGMSGRTDSLFSPFTNSKAAQPLQNTPSSANYSSLSSSNLDDVDEYENDGYYSRYWDE